MRNRTDSMRLAAFFLSSILCTHALAFVPGAGAPLPRRAVLSLPAIAAVAPQQSRAISGVKPTFQHSLTSVEVSGVTIPVAIWTPASDAPAATANPATYPYKIDIGKIANKLKVGWLSWLPKFEYNLPCGTEASEALPGFGRAAEGDAIMFAHGFLGSVYDFAHAAEALAADGFTVVAPELPESLSASYVPSSGMSRAQIIAGARELVEGSGRWGIFGHSAGAGSAMMQGGAYTLGRACFAGGAMSSGSVESADPLFLCSSNGDGCNAFMNKGVAFDLRPLLAGAADTTMFASLEDAYMTPTKPPARGAFVFADDNSPLPLPCHISFLWAEVNEAMVSLLSPFLPLAKALGLFLLDFDVYRENRDADQTAARLVPALRRFFLSSSAQR
jgi:pimeloyl-ACP methyl ester carboxylesterase